MRINSRKLKEFIRSSVVKKLNEQTIQYSDILPGAPTEFYEYATKVEKFLLETAEKAEELRLEGMDIMRVDILGGRDSSVKVSEMNRYINKYASSLHKVRGNIMSLLESILREA